MIKKALAAAALVVVAIFAVPTAAQAAYVPDNLITAPGTIAPGGSGTVGFGAGAFTPGETVSFTLTGENASGATLAAVVSAVSSISTSKAASANGATSVSVTLPSNASGSYSLTATGASSGNIASVAIAGVAAGGSGSSSGTDAGTGSGLPNTGAMDPTLGIWAGGGLLALGAAFIIVLTVVRRQKASN